MAIWLGEMQDSVDGLINRTTSLNQHFTDTVKTYNTGEFVVRLLIMGGAIYFGFNIGFAVMMAVDYFSPLLAGLLALVLLLAVVSGIVAVVRFTIIWLKAQEEQRASNRPPHDPE